MAGARGKRIVMYGYDYIVVELGDTPCADIAGGDFFEYGAGGGIGNGGYVTWGSDGAHSMAGWRVYLGSCNCYDGERP